jgi:membrane-bound inhibitor of C-type lysozyme
LIAIESAPDQKPFGEKMNKRKIASLIVSLIVSLGAALVWGTIAPSAALAQTTFKNYRCADGTQFIVGFFQYDSRAHLQLDGKAVTLAKRLALSGSRYTGSGVTLKITRAGLTTLKHAKRPATACEQT